MTHAEIHERLRTIAPSIAFAASRTYDDYNTWDGDGPDPEDAGYLPYVVTITATTVHDGRLIEGDSHLSSCYMLDEEEIGDMHGYLPQQLEEAAVDLMEQISHGSVIKTQAADAVDFLQAEMRRRYAGL